MEGFTTADWLAPDDLYALAAQLLPGQVHIFSATREVIENEFMQAGLANGSIVAHDTSLAEFLGTAEDTGALVRPPCLSG